MTGVPVVGMYAPGNSPVHRTGARTKLLVLVAAGIAVSLTDNAWLLAAAILGILALLGSTRVPIASALGHLRALLPLLAAVLAAHGWLSTWRSGILIDLRIVALVLTATTVTLTTRTSEMIDQIERLLRPLRRVGISPSRAALVISMAIRFVPVLAAQAHQVREAQRARGVERTFLALLVPLLVKTLQTADQIAEALQARGMD